mmetsp:Transcript_110695/g.155390  ORF Transcript_110695/g.155390 Transcript_110695/m.155390 type:complete len:87 (+) Transcript_110695:396-656(+)
MAYHVVSTHPMALNDLETFVAFLLHCFHGMSMSMIMAPIFHFLPLEDVMRSTVMIVVMTKTCKAYKTQQARKERYHGTTQHWGCRS